MKAFAIMLLVGLGLTMGCKLNSPEPLESKPLSPINLRASAQSPSEILLEWTDGSNDEDGFEVFESIQAEGGFGVLTRTGPNIDSVLISGKTPATTYYYYVSSYRGAYYSLKTATVSVTTPEVGDTPVSPSQLRAVAISSTEIDLTWQDDSDNEDGFIVERKFDASGTWTEIARTNGNVTSFQNIGLVNSTTYYYRVQAYNSEGKSGYSNDISATTNPSIPIAPSNLQTSVISSVRIDLAWTDNSDNEIGFKIERKIGAEGNWTETGQVAAGVSTYQNTGLSGSTSYYYRVCAFNEGGSSGYSNESNVRTPAVDATPEAPSDLRTTSILSTQISISWRDNSSTEDGFVIERKTGAGGVWAEIARTNRDVVSYLNTGLESSTSYYFRVKAYNGIGSSSYSNEVSASTPSRAPDAPTGLQITTISSVQIDLNWIDNANNETGFIIERKTGPGGVWAEIGQVATDVLNYNCTGLTAATTYYFRVCAFNDGGNSGYSNEAFGATNDVAPAAPSTLVATATSASQINLTWSDNSTNETGFKIERKTGAGGAWSEIGQVNAGIVAYNNTGLSGSTLYYYRTKAFNQIGNSSYSNEANATTQDVIPIRVIQPNGGESYARNESMSIRWQATGGIQQVTIQLLKAGNPVRSIVSGTENDGQIDWGISVLSGETGNDLRIRIKDYNNVNVFDDSDANFTISQ